LNQAALFSAACLRVRFEDCDLREADFDGGDLSGAVFRRCQMGGARMLGATLRGADVRGCAIDGIVMDASCIRGLVIDEAQAGVVARLLGVDVRALGDER
jgi:uncharacterized protein YjbI with pentapeptide repeats